MSRIEILKISLEKKQKLFDQKLQEHFEAVKQANGQPLNDKRNGAATIRKWDRQNDALKSLQDGIEKTKGAIEREEWKIKGKDSEYASFPPCVQEAISAGTLKQWGKHPHILFVSGVETGRIVVEDDKILARYHNKIPTKEQYSIFRDVFNGLLKKIKGVENA